MHEKEWLTLRETIILLRSTKAKVKWLLKKGRFPGAINLNDQMWMLPTEDVIAELNRQRRENEKAG